MIEYFIYYQHWYPNHPTTSEPSRLSRPISEELALKLKKEGLPPGEFLVGPYTGMRKKEDEKEKEQV